MRSMIFAAAVTFLLWGTPAASQLPDSDGDGFADAFDNCSDTVNPGQVDSDGDDCGNVCDADYDQTGVVGFLDTFKFGDEWAGTNPIFCHTAPILPCIVGFPDLGFLVANFGSSPGPSGTTLGTTACP